MDFFSVKIRKILNKIWNSIDFRRLSSLRGTRKENDAEHKCSNQADHKILLLSRSLYHGNMVSLLDIIINQRSEPTWEQG